MNKSINTSPEQKNLEELINKKINDIFDENTWIGKDLWKIAEVTFSYDSDTGINTTLFEKAGELNIEEYKKSNKEKKEKLLLEAKNKLLFLLNEKKSLIEKALSEIKGVVLENSYEIDIISIFINSLEEKNSFINYCIKALPFELGKAGIDLGLSQEEEKSIEEEIEIYDKILFGGKIKNNPEETKLSYEYILEKYQLDGKNNLTKEEQKRFEGYLNKIKKYLPKGYKHKAKEKPKQIAGDFLNVNIPREDYMLGFNILVESLEKLEHIVESNNSTQSISDGPKGVQFPTTEKFDYMNILRFSKLANHEIETHNITDYNGKLLIGNMRGEKSTEKDEGVAMLMEQLFMYGNELYKTDKDGDKIIDIEKIQINSYFIKTLMGELLNNKELLDFLELSEKFDPDVISPKDRFERLKRLNKKGVQHKDTTYTRGLFKAINEINKYIKSKGKEGITPEDLFLGKISFNETHKLKNIKKAREKSEEKIETIKPLFISDAVYFIINEKLEGREGNINGENYYKYLLKKYPIFNFTKQQVKAVSYSTKRNVYGIVNILLKNIGEHQLNSIGKTQKRNNKILLNIIGEQYKPKIEKVKTKMHPVRKNAS